MTEIETFDQHLKFLFLLFKKMSTISVYHFHIKQLNTTAFIVVMCNCWIWKCLPLLLQCFLYCGFGFTINLSSTYVIFLEIFTLGQRVDKVSFRYFGTVIFCILRHSYFKGFCLELILYFPPLEGIIQYFSCGLGKGLPLLVVWGADVFVHISVSSLFIQWVYWGPLGCCQL